MLTDYDISDEQAERLWRVVADHAPTDGECPRCRVPQCRTRGEAIGSLKLAGRYAAGPVAPVVPPEAQLRDEPSGYWGDAVSTAGVWIPASELTP